MPDLSFQVECCEAIPYAAVPMLGLKVRISNQPFDQAVHTLTLRCQVQIEPAKRHYAAAEQEKLRDLFGEPERWGRTVRPMLWMNTSVSVPGFTGATVATVELPCSFDFNVAATKYFNALERGEISIGVMFSGTVFYAGPDGSLQITQVPWDREVNFRLPVATWKSLMDAYYPETAWLCLRRDVFERLYDFKVLHGIPTWERLMDRLLMDKLLSVDGRPHKTELDIAEAEVDV